MEQSGIVPDVLDKLPTGRIEVYYGSYEVISGANELKPTQVHMQPKVVWSRQKDAFYTLCLVDPDSPSRCHPHDREWLHWLVVNIPGKHVFEGDTKAEYIGPGPNKGSGLHRFIFVVFKQSNGRQNFSRVKRITSKSTSGRSKFSIRAFAKEHKLGQPVAVNMFYSQWDKQVPEIHCHLDKNIGNS